MEYRVCNTGDQIWIAERFGEPTVVKIITHDGIFFSEEHEPRILKREGHEDVLIYPLVKLEGVEKYIHKAEVFCLKLIFKLLA